MRPPAKHYVEEEDLDIFALLGFFYLQWAIGASCSVIDWDDDLAALSMKYFGRETREIKIEGKL